MALDETRLRLIDAAGHEFAEKGFEGATVRAICDRAGVNLAAINYHFGDKERLYEAVLLLAHRSRPAPEPDPPGTDSRESLQRFVADFFAAVAHQETAPWHQGVMSREIAAPSKASDALIREAFLPRFEYLTAILRRLCPESDRRQIHAVAFSLIGQCLHYKTGRSISERIIGEAAYTELTQDYLVGHITRFTLAALGQAAPLTMQDDSDPSRTLPPLRKGDR